MNPIRAFWLIACCLAAAPLGRAQDALPKPPQASPSNPTPATEQPSPPWAPAGVGPLAGQTPHPAVVRVTAPGRKSVSYGSGCLVAANDRHGLVITNWHVINEATGTITVEFPDGFESAASVQKVDREWDLAALAIWKPRAAPAPLSRQAPQPGDWLTIAGYGSGKYRAVSGACTQYVAPGLKMPYEMVEVSVAARQGDSGGPIFNMRGELAGVLFGAGDGRTSGSYCGRVHWFLDSVAGPQGLPSGGPFDAGGPVFAGGRSGPAAGAISPGNSQLVGSPQQAMQRTTAPVVAANAFGRPRIAGRTATTGEQLQSLSALAATGSRASRGIVPPAVREPAGETHAMDPTFAAQPDPVAAISATAPFAGKASERTFPQRPESGASDRLVDVTDWHPIAVRPPAGEDRNQAQPVAETSREPIAGPAARELARETTSAKNEPLAAAVAPPSPVAESVAESQAGETAITRWDQIKAFLGVVGAAGFFLWLARTLTASQAPQKAPARKPAK